MSEVVSTELLAGVIQAHAILWCPVCREQCPVTSVDERKEGCPGEVIDWLTVTFECVHHQINVSVDVPLAEARELL